MPANPRVEDVRTGLTVPLFKRAFTDNLFYARGRFPEVATRNDLYLALAYTVRDRLLERWVRSGRGYGQLGARTVCYLSAEFLLGPHLGSNLVSLGILEVARQALAELGHDLDDLLEHEEEPGLGNGGLGRLAACYLDSLATLRIPSIAYGLRYEFGIFDQEIRDGWQMESTDKWLHLGNPWEIAQPEIVHHVLLGGRTHAFTDAHGRYRVLWTPERVLKGVAFDTPILGYRTGTANLLRLWTAEAHEAFDFEAFNVGDYWRAVHEKIRSENVTKVLYPNDEPEAGKQLRLEQQYFFVSCSLQDMIRIQLQRDKSLDRFHEKWAIQLNDTHPAVAVAELMRLLVDGHGMAWEQAWDITRQSLAYTNHTLLPEALEKWPVGLFGRLLPRHLEIVYEINRRFLADVRLRHPGDEELVRRLSLIDEGGERYVRMAHLAAVGSHAINGVARLHSELLADTVLRDFHRLDPGKISNKTNGVTPRRFLLLANPRLSRILDEVAGAGWPVDLDRLRALEPLADEAHFRQRWHEVKRANKRDLARLVHERTNQAIDPEAMLDVQVKRIHEYKRQHLNILHVISLYLRGHADPGFETTPRTVLFAGKAAPGYYLAKLIIKLVNSVAEVVNRDPRVRDWLKVVFFPDYNVRNAQHILPAAELSEQISTAGKEASGTGNMKMTMNGALTIGTLDGANVEIREQVGEDNFFLFGLRVEEVAERLASGYQPAEVYRQDPLLREVIDLIASGHFSHGDRELFRPLVDNLLHHDRYLVLADFADYVACQEEVARAWRDRERWTRMSILNTARSGYFSSDRAIAEYCRDVWRVEPVEAEALDRIGP